MTGLVSGVALVLLVVFVTASLLVALVLFAMRAGDAWLQGRRARHRSEILGLLFDALLGEAGEGADARSALTARSGRSWDTVEQIAFQVLPKIKGAARATLIGLLREKGAVRRAERRAVSTSAVRRCHGVYELGALGVTDAVPLLVTRLRDRDFLVRRVSVRALGNLQDERAVTPLLALVEEEPRLARDVVYALDRIGPAGAPQLRAALEASLDDLADDPDPDPGTVRHHPEVAATILGLVGDVRAVPLLARALGAPHTALAVASAEALGEIGSPDIVPALVEAMHADRVAVRRAAARALGAVGSASATAGLAEVVVEDDPEVSREAAQALLSMGPAGIETLAATGSPYAVESLALAAVRGGR